MGFVASRRVFSDGHESVGEVAGIRGCFGCAVNSGHHQRRLVRCELRCDSHHAIVGVPGMEPALGGALRRSGGPLCLSVHTADFLQLRPRCVPSDVEQLLLVFRRCHAAELSRHEVADLSSAQRLINEWQRTQLARDANFFPRDTLRQPNAPSQPRGTAGSTLLVPTT